MGQFKDNRQFIAAVTPTLWMLTFWWALSCGCTVVASGNWGWGWSWTANSGGATGHSV